MSVSVGEAVGYLDLDISGFLANLRTAQSEANSTTSNMATTVGTNLTKAGKSLTSAGTTLTKGFTIPIATAGTACVTLSAKFESAMSTVSALSGATGNDLDDLRLKALEMGSKTKFSASEAAEGFQYMALAGWDTKSMLEGIEPILKLAGAAELDLGTTSDIVTDALTAMGLEAKDTARFTDVLATTMSSSNTDITQMGEAFKYAAPLCGTLGYSVEDLGIALGQMANSGIKGSNAGTALRQTLLNMADPTDETAKAMEELGISMFNEDGSARSLRDVLEQLRTSLSGCTDEQKAQYASALAGATGMSGLLAIVDASEESWNNLANAVDNAEGSTNDMYDTMQNNLGGQLTILKSTLESLAISIGDLMLPLIKDIVAKIQSWVEWLNNLDESQKQTIIKVATIAATVGPVLVIIGKLITGLGSLFTAVGSIPKVVSAADTTLSTLGTIIGGISAPIIAAVAAIALLVAAFVDLWKNNEEFRNKMTAIWDGLKQKFEQFGQGIVDRLNALGFNFEDFTEVLEALWNGFCEMVAPVFESVFQHISNVFGFVLDTITGILDIFIGLFTGNWDQVWTGVKEIFGAVWDFIKNTFTNCIDSIKNAADIVLGWFGTTWNEMWTSVKEFFANIWDSIVTFFSNAVSNISTAVSNFVKTVTDFFVQLFTNIKNFITDVFNSIKTWVTDMVSKAKEMGTNFVDTVVSFFTQLPGKVLRFITSALENVIVWAGDMKEKALDMAQGFLNNVADTIKNLPGKVKEFLDDTISKCASWVSDMKQKGTEAISGLIENVKSAAANIAEDVMSIGSNIVDGVWNGIQDAKDMFVSNVKSFFSGIVDSVKQTLGIASPSKVFRDEVGKWLPPGVAKGFESAMPGAMKDIQDSLDGAMSKLDTDTDMETFIDTKSFANQLKSMYTDLVLWFESIEGRMHQTVDNMKADLMYLVDQGKLVANSDGTLGYVGYGGFDNTVAKNRTVDNLDDTRYNNSGNGDTFIFYSNKEIDEIEAARQMKKTKRDMAEGF